MDGPGSGRAATGISRCADVWVAASRLVAGILALAVALTVGSAEIDPRQREQGEPDDHEHAEERVHLSGTGEEQRQRAEADADPVDQQHGLAVRQPDVEQAMVEVAPVRRERRPALGEPPDDDPERVDDRDREHEQRHGDLGRAEDRQDRQRVAHEHHAARADEHGRRVEVPAQEPEQRAGQREAEDRDVGLASRASG